MTQRSRFSGAANAHFYLAFFFLQGGLWHYQRAMGFDLSSTLANWRQNIATATENPILTDQKPVHSQPQPLLQVQYGAPDAEPQPLLAIEQPFEDFLYHPSQGILRPALATAQRASNTLYQTTYYPRKQTFYQNPAPVTAKAGYGGRTLGRLYEPPKTAKDVLNYPRPLAAVVYEPSQTQEPTPESRPEAALAQ